MDRARRAEPYSSATLWTREVARNLAGHLARVSNVHSCVDTGSPKTTQLPKFHHSKVLKDSKRCTTSPVKTRIAATPLHSSVLDCSSGEECHGGDNQSADIRAQNHSEKLHHNKVSAKHPPDCELQPESDHLLEPIKVPIGLEKVRLPAQTHIKTVSGTAESTYDCPPTLGSRKAEGSMDYNKKQAQLKIWKENQALAKRLRSTKPTLRSKEWEKDDKWNQEFLKSQEKRRSLLQTEIEKAQMPPPHTTIVRVRPAKLPHQEPISVVQPNNGEFGLKEIIRCNTTGGDGAVSGSLSARELRRRRSHGKSLNVEPLGECEVNHLHSSAANHRRIMQLRQQKSQEIADSSGAIDLNDDELVDVRFTFLRRKNRRGSKSNGTAGAEMQVDTKSSLGKIVSKQSTMLSNIEIEQLECERVRENEVGTTTTLGIPLNHAPDKESTRELEDWVTQDVIPDTSEFAPLASTHETEENENEDTEPPLPDLVGEQGSHETLQSNATNCQNTEIRGALDNATSDSTEELPVDAGNDLPPPNPSDRVTGALAKDSATEYDPDAEPTEYFDNNPSITHVDSSESKHSSDIYGATRPDIDSETTCTAQSKGNDEPQIELYCRDDAFTVDSKSEEIQVLSTSSTAVDPPVLEATFTQSTEAEIELSHYDSPNESSEYGSEFDDDEAKDCYDPELPDNELDRDMASESQAEVDEIEYSQDDFSDN